MVVQTINKREQLNSPRSPKYNSSLWQFTEYAFWAIFIPWLLIWIRARQKNENNFISDTTLTMQNDSILQFVSYLQVSLFPSPVCPLPM